MPIAPFMKLKSDLSSLLLDQWKSPYYSLLSSYQLCHCAHTNQSINFVVKLLSKQEPLNGREKKRGETTKYLYFSNFFDSKKSQKKLINVKLTKVLQYIVC
jgi:hypothetical protein